MSAPSSSPAPILPWRERLLVAYRRTDWRGFTRLMGWLKPPGARRELMAATRYGSHFWLNPYDIVDHHVIAEGFYESEVIEALRPGLTEPGAVLWVIGANFGLHAVTAKHLFPQARVIAFEPSPHMASRLIEHAQLNQVEIELHSYALAGQTSVLAFYANASGNPGMSTLHPVAGGSYQHRFHVATTTPHAIIQSGTVPAPTLLLVDAEGAETEILAGFGPLLADPALRRVVFEAPNAFLTERNPAELHALITQAGFDLSVLERRENTAHSLSNFLACRSTASN